MHTEREKQLWYNAEKNNCHQAIFDYVSTVERRQSKLFQKFIRLAALYDPLSVRSDPYGNGFSEHIGISENVIASNVDTVAAAISSSEVRARFMTDDAMWSQQRMARHLEWYAEGLCALLDIDAKCRSAFKAAALKGTGLIQVYIDGFNELRAELTPIDEIIVDEVECRDGAPPRQMHRRKYVDRESLKAQFPKHARAIEVAQSSVDRVWKMWSGYRPLESNEVVIIESWRLPAGKIGKPRYLPGRHVISIDGATILDEKYEKPHYPFARMVWSEPVAGWYGISGAERIAGHQRTLSKRNVQIDRQLDQLAFPTTYVRMADANLSVKTTNRLGTIAVVKGEIPQTVIPPAVSQETYASRETIKASAFEEFGVSRMAAQSVKPAGLDSGVALREYRDQTTQRFSIQEKNFERLKLDVVTLLIDCCKDLGSDAPEVMHRSKFGRKTLKWSDVDMGDVRISIAAASTISRTPAGRIQTVIEWAQAGIVSQDEARRLLRHPDLERSMSIYTSALEDIEYTIEAIEDGQILMPEPYQNLKLGVWRCQMEYLKIRTEGAPEEILEALRQWITQAAYILSGGDQPESALPSEEGAMMPGAEQPLPPGAELPPEMMAEMPTGPAPEAALAPEAMQLMAQ
jgi:hypothetical protein